MHAMEFKQNLISPKFRNKIKYMSFGQELDLLYSLWSKKKIWKDKTEHDNDRHKVKLQTHI